MQIKRNCAETAVTRDLRVCRGLPVVHVKVEDFKERLEQEELTLPKMTNTAIGTNCQSRLVLRTIAPGN